MGGGGRPGPPAAASILAPLPNTPRLGAPASPPLAGTHLPSPFLSALSPPLRPAPITPEGWPSAKLGRAAARKHRRTRGRGGRAGGPRRQGKVRMVVGESAAVLTKAGPSANQWRCLESLRILAGGPAPDASSRDATREKRRSRRGPAALPCSLETLSPHPRPTQNCARPPINYAARCPLQARPDVLWPHPSGILSSLCHLGSGRSETQPDKNAGQLLSN